MKSLFAALLFVSFLGTTLNAEARGPYLPSDSNLVLPGELLARGGLSEDCDQWGNEPCNDPYHEHVLIQKPAVFELGVVGYLCELIDDGAYGALSCQQADYNSTSRIFTTCFKEGSAPNLTTDFYFGNWVCR